MFLSSYRLADIYINQIWFDVHNTAFRSATGQMDFEWIAELAEHKAKYFPNLSKLRVVELQLTFPDQYESKAFVPEPDTTGICPPIELIERFKLEGIVLDLRQRIAELW